MLTFEEFFKKKKIDLAALRLADKQLFDEFQLHYVAMGEKSFDHTKKFWFNRLRKNYLLAEEVQEVKVKTEKLNEAVVENISTSETKPKLGFKPKFKTTIVRAETLEVKEEITGTPEQISKPAGFKPRFKAGVTKTTESEKVQENKEIPSPKKERTETPEAINKPAGFKPRFKAGVTKTIESENVQENKEIPSPKEEITETTEQINKPAGFKPRFKAGVTKNKPSTEDNN